MHIIITGGLGFIGSHIASQLLKEKHEVTILDNKTTSVVREIPGVRVVVADLSDEQVVAALNLPEAACIMHLGGPSSGPAAQKEPVKTISLGYLITYNILNFALRMGIKRFLHASSMVVYGNVGPNDNPVDERTPCYPISHYGISKFANERFVATFCKQNGIGYNNLRMFNVYGPGQDLTRMDQGLVSIFLAMLIKGPEVLVKGHLERFRDVVHIDDVVQAWILCGTRNQVDGDFNIASGETVTIGDVIRTIADELGILDKLLIREEAGTPGDIAGISADIRALKAATGFHPKYPPALGIRAFTRWAVTNAQ